MDKQTKEQYWICAMCGAETYEESVEDIMRDVDDNFNPTDYERPDDGSDFIEEWIHYCSKCPHQYEVHLLNGEFLEYG